MDLFVLLAMLTIAGVAIGIFLWSARLRRAAGPARPGPRMKAPRPRHINPKTGDPFP